MCSEKVRLHVHSLVTILGLIVNMIKGGDLHDQLLRK